MADDFKKLSKDFGKLNKAMESLQASSDAQLKERKSAINAVSDPMSQGSDPQAKALAKVQETQNDALSKLVGYQLGTSPRKQKKLQAKKDKLETTDRKSAMRRTSSLDIMAAIMKTGAGDKKKEESKLDKITKKRKEKRAEFYKEARANGKTVKQAFKQARLQEGIQNKFNDLTKQRETKKLKNSFAYRKKQLKIMDKNTRQQGLTSRLFDRFTMSEEEIAEKKREREEKHKSLLAGLGIMSEDITTEIKDSKPKKTSFISKIFGWLKKGALLAAIGGLLGDWIGNWLGDKIDGVFGENSWLGKLVKDNGWWIGIGALLAVPLIPLLAPLLAPLAGLLVPLLGALAPIAGIGALLAGAGILGYMAGGWLYDNMVGPWLDGYYERENKKTWDAKNAILKTTSSQATVVDEKTGEILPLYRIYDPELQESLGGKHVATEKEIMAASKKKGSFQDLMAPDSESGEAAVGKAMTTKTGAGSEALSKHGGLSEGMSSGDLEKAQKEESEIAELSTEAQGGGRFTGKGKEAFGEMREAARKLKLIEISNKMAERENDIFRLFKAPYDDSESAETAAQKVRELLNDAKSDFNRMLTLTRDKGRFGKPLLEASDYSSMKDLFPFIWDYSKGSYAAKRNQGASFEVDYESPKSEAEKTMTDADDTKFLLMMDHTFDESQIAELLGEYDMSGDRPGGSIWKQKKGGSLLMGDTWDAFSGSVKFAKGGLVTGPVHALIGEAGPEAVIPLDRAAGVIGAALSKATQSPSTLALASQRNALNAMDKSAGAPSAAKTNVNVINNQSSSSYMNFTPSATLANGPAWIKTMCDH